MGLYILVPLSVVLVFVIGGIFWWSVRSGQFDDLEGPGFRLLVDDKDAPPAESDDHPAVCEESVSGAGGDTVPGGDDPAVRDDQSRRHEA